MQGGRGGAKSAELLGAFIVLHSVESLFEVNAKDQGRGAIFQRFKYLVVEVDQEMVHGGALYTTILGLINWDGCL